MSETEPLSREACLKRLAEAAERLGRYPKRSDFSDAEVNAIKGWFGPWGRALEAADVKPARTEDRLAKNKEKRARAKQRRHTGNSVSPKNGDPETGRTGVNRQQTEERKPS